MGQRLLRLSRPGRQGVLSDPANRKGLIMVRWCLIARVLYLYLDRSFRDMTDVAEDPERGAELLELERLVGFSQARGRQQ